MAGARGDALMSSLLRKLWPFPGGVRLESHKEISTGVPIEAAPIPRELVIPLRQHVGETPELLVEVGEQVLAGQMLAQASSYLSAAIHASSSGTITAIEPRPVPHPSGLSALCVVIETDGEDRWAEPLPPLDYLQAEPELIRRRAREAGIVGLGGAAFPAAVKLDAQVQTLILNAAECEPYISCDDMLMRERAVEVVEGLKILRRALGAEHCVIGIEDNKPQAYEALLAAVGEADIEIVQVPTRYPAGGEKQLIQTLTGLEVPADGLPLDLGIVCHNVGTAAALHQAVAHGRPLISRIVTVTGAAVARPCNLEVRIGTPMRALIEACDGYSSKVDRLLMGGPMMGFAVQDDALPIVKTSNCILAGTAAEFPRLGEAMPCIRCGACAEACPVSLLPQQLYWFARARDFDKAREYDVFDCIECGACAYSCPSHIPLVQYYRYAKSELWAAERERQQADVARGRHAFRQLRLEREKEEAAERRRRKKEALAQPKAAAADPKKDAIAAALARAKQKKVAQASVPAAPGPDSEQ
jgi:electron transport complex protein RnfC